MAEETTPGVKPVNNVARQGAAGRLARINANKPPKPGLVKALSAYRSPAGP